MFDELVAATEDARDNTELVAIVLSGAGRSFCAGLDFTVHKTLAGEGAAGQRPFADPNDPNSTGQRLPGRGQRIVRALRDSPVPVIAAMHGHAIGGGLQLALGADIRIVTAETLLGCAEIDFGMTVDMGGSQLLPRLIGADRTLDLLVSGRRISGVEAVSWGLATRISDDPISEAFELARGSLNATGRRSLRRSAWCGSLKPPPWKRVCERNYQSCRATSASPHRCALCNSTARAEPDPITLLYRARAACASESNSRPTMICWISATPCATSKKTASRYRRSTTMSRVKPYAPQTCSAAVAASRAARLAVKRAAAASPAIGSPRSNWAAHAITKASAASV